ncbi:MAG: RecX family transcriptional regulator [Actinomycetota bacterium]
MSSRAAGVPVGEELPAQTENAMDKAMHLLGHRSRSRHEMSRRLLEGGFSESTVEAVDARLHELGLLDDAAFVREVCRSRSRAGWSSTRIGHDLAYRGVASELIDEGLAELDQQGISDADRALKLALSKARSSCSVPREKALPRVVRHLYGKGYESELAWEAARAAFRELDEA